MKRFSRTMALFCLAAAAAPVHAVVVFSDDFDTDHSANWTFNSSIGAGDGPADAFGGEANAFFDYSTLAPSANGPGGTTRGMWFTANVPGTGVFSAVTMTLNSQTFDFANTAYKITADVWLNYHFHPTGAGTTEEVMMGVGANPGVSQLPGGSFNSVMFATSTDGDSGIDWRAYKTPWPDGAVGRVQQNESGVYAANPDGTPVGTSSTNNTDPYYVSHFPGGDVPPPVQVSNFPDQANLSSPAGTVAFAWHRWTITTTPNGGPISWYVSDANGDDVLIATIQGGDTNPYTLGGDSIYFGIFDINAGSAPLGFNAETLLFGLIDNVVVEDLSVALIKGDVNGDGVVNSGDINPFIFALSNPEETFQSQFPSGIYLNADVNGPGFLGDGFVNAADINPFIQILSGSGEPGIAAALAAIPEPGSIGLLALIAAPLLRRRRA